MLDLHCMLFMATPRERLISSGVTHKFLFTRFHVLDVLVDVFERVNTKIPTGTDGQGFP